MKTCAIYVCLVMLCAFQSFAAGADEYVMYCGLAMAKKHAPASLPKAEALGRAEGACECVGKQLSEGQKSLFVEVAILATLPKDDARERTFRKSFGSDEELAEAIMDLSLASKTAGRKCGLSP